MPEIIIRICIDYLAGFRVAMDRCEAKIADVAWSAGFVEQDVPIGLGDVDVEDI
jgi:hypothetical protein